MSNVKYCQFLKKTSHLSIKETKPVLPCLHEHLEKRDADTYDSPLKKGTLRYDRCPIYCTEVLQQNRTNCSAIAFQPRFRWKTRNGMTAAELLIEFFEFYALGFRVADYVVSVQHAGGISKVRLWLSVA